MGIERRRAPRWRAPNYRLKLGLRHGNGQRSEAILIDVSNGGVGIRTNGDRLAVGAQLALEIEIQGRVESLNGVVRFVDRFFPRVGVSLAPSDAADAVVGRAISDGFHRFEIKGSTLHAYGKLTLESVKGLGAVPRYKTLNLSGVADVSVAGVGAIVLGVRGRGAKIDCCSGAIAPVVNSLGICGNGMCVSADPCKLPKSWSARVAEAADE